MTTAAFLHSVKITDAPKLRRLGRKNEIVFEFAPGVNVLAGPNGSGKSSLLQFLSQDYHDGVKIRAKKGGTRFFDFEKQNPRTQELCTVPAGAYGFSLLARMQLAGSHGQVTSTILQVIAKEPTAALYFLDEPEQALDTKQIEALASSLIALGQAGGQAVLATHHPRLILEPSFHVIELRRGYVTRTAKHALTVGQLAETRLRR